MVLTEQPRLRERAKEDRGGSQEGFLEESKFQAEVPTRIAG